MIINFEGEIVKPNKNGQYKCPYNCHRQDYPAPKWKQKGFGKHMTSCSNRPSFIQKKAEEKTQLDEQLKLIFGEVVRELPFKIGDKINIVQEFIIKPTHDERGRRLRYEPVINFSAREIEIKTIDFKKPDSLRDKEYIKSNCILINRDFRISCYRESRLIAESDAKSMQESYDESVRFAKFCR